MHSANLSGVERAAVFLYSLGEEDAAAVLRHLDPTQVQNVGTAIANLSSVSDEEMSSVFADFTETMEESKRLTGTDSFVKNMLDRALGTDKARGMIGRILQGQDPKGLETLKWMDAKAVAEILREEHPQICAIVLLSLDPEHAASILKLIEPEKRSGIMVRVAQLDTVKPDALEELDELIGRQLLEKEHVAESPVDGIRSAAQILNYMDSETEATILEEIVDANEDLGESIREKMFIFENLMILDDKDMQRMLREIETESLVVALKGAEEAIRNRFFSNMSKRAAELLEEDIAMRGPMKLVDVENAQKEILTLAARLADEGEITMSAKGEDEYV